MYLGTSAVMGALLPWQPNSPTSIKCLRSGAAMVLLHFFSVFFFLFNLAILFHVPVLKALSGDIAMVLYPLFFC